MKLSTRLKVIGITVAMPALAALVLGGVSSINRPSEPTIKYSTPEPVEKIKIIEPAPNQTTEKPVPAETVAPSAVIVEEKSTTPTIDNSEEQEEVAMFDGCRADQIVYTIHLNSSEEKWNEMKSDGIYSGSRIPVQSHTLYRHPTLGDYCFVN